MGRTSYHGPCLLIALIFFGLLWALIFIAFFAHAPILCASFVGLLYVVGLYLATEGRWRWHDAQEFENRFWTVTAFLFSTAVLYAKDSPFAIGQWNSSCGGVLVVLFTLAVQFYDRSIHRQEISRKPRLRTSSSQQAFAQNLFNYRATAQEKASVVSKCVEIIDRMYLPSTINNMINQTHVKRQEHRIFRILAGASKEELNYIINHVKLALLFYKVKDHSRMSNDKNRSLMLELLCKQRVADLTVMSKAVVLDALMVMKLSAHPQSEEFVCNLILRTNGDDLSRLKTFTDSKGDVHSMQKLIFLDIRSESIRNTILAHIKQQAAVQAAHMSLGTKYARQRRLKAWRKVLSDVDDTLYSSGGRYPAGMDLSYPRHALYPGVLPFYRELDLGVTGKDEWEDGRTGNLAFLSARPHVYKAVSESQSYAKFQKLYEEKGMHTLPTLLPGSIRSGRAFMMKGDLEPMAVKKFENFQEYYQLYPEFTHVFIGDNGQGDVRAAELIVETYGTRALEASYFHIVQPIARTHGYTEDALDRWKRMNIFFFDTYVGAAVQAYRLNQIRWEGLVRIAERAVIDFESISNWSLSKDRENARTLLNRDLSEANEILKEIIDCDKKLSLIKKPQLYSISSRVITKYGEGVVQGYREVEGIYFVELTSWRLIRGQPVLGFFQEEQLSTLPPLPVDHDSGFEETSRTLLRNPLSSFSKDPELKDVHMKHTLVRTKHFGIGNVQKYRKKDKVYRLIMPNLIHPSIDNMVHFYCRSDNFQPIEEESSLTSPVFSGVRSSFNFLSNRFSFLGTPSEKELSHYAIGTLVSTPFGDGTIIQQHLDPSIAIVELKNQKALAYLQKKQVSRILMSSPVQSHSSNRNSIDSTTSSRNLFSLLGLSNTEDSSLYSSKQELAIGMTIMTRYGSGVIRKYREVDDVFVVELTWKHESSPSSCFHLPLGYFSGTELRSQLLENARKESTDTDSSSRYGSSILSFIRRGFNNEEEDKNSSSAISTSSQQWSSMDIDVGEEVTTPFGDGIIISRSSSSSVVQVEIHTLRSTQLHEGKKNLVLEPMQSITAYCQLSQVTRVSRRSFGLNIFGDTISFLKDTLTRSPRHQPQLSKEPKDLLKPIFANGSYVETPFGDGRVLQFYPLKQTYKVQQDLLISYVQEKDLSWSCCGRVDYPVLTTFGTGILREIRENDGVHVVDLRQMASGSMVGYLQYVNVLALVSAAVGDHVSTPFGPGMVLKYRPNDGIYEIALKWSMNRPTFIPHVYLHESCGLKRIQTNESLQTNHCHVM